MLISRFGLWRFARGLRTVNRSLSSGRTTNQKRYEYFDRRFDKGNANLPPWVVHRYKFMAGSVAAVGTFYYVSHLEKVPISGRTRYMDCDQQTETAMSTQAFTQILAQFKHQILPAYHPLTLYVKKVAERIIKGKCTILLESSPNPR